MEKPLASLSLDLDDKWTYLRTHGRDVWQSYPSYLPTVVPRILEFLDERGLRITFFVVGRDARRSENRPLLTAMVAAGHEVGNHTENHYPWLKSLSIDEIELEVIDAESAIEQATGQRCIGFRAPGFSSSPALVEVLSRRNYAYDASSFPSFLGPMARAYCRLTSPFNRRRRPPKRDLFGSWRDGFAPLKPFVVGQPNGLVEIPVTTMPLFRLPFHLTYLLYLRQIAGAAWRTHLRTALALCRARGVAPSMLLHPLDFLGCEDEPDLSFFPGMKLPRQAKLAVVDETLQRIGESFQMAPLAETAAVLLGRAAGDSADAPKAPRPLPAPLEPAAV